MSKKEREYAEHSAEEATRRMNEALKRALNMPAKPHKPGEGKTTRTRPAKKNKRS